MNYIRLFVALSFGVGYPVVALSNPNIVFIFMEDMGPHIGPYGDFTAHTPQLNRLAKEGCVYTRGAQVTAATCAPSRASLFTGLYPHQNGVFGFVHADGFYLRPGVPNFVRTLRDAGYRTGITYKTGVDPEEDLGFDESYAPTVNRLLREKSEHEVSNCIDNVRYFLQSQPKDRPFYLQAQTSDTHSPWDREDRHDSIRSGSPDWPYPDIDLAKIRPGKHLGDGFVLDNDAREMLRGYYRAVQRVDYFVGAVLDALKESGYQENTLVVFSSDHGPSHMLRGKGYPYEIGLKVPFIVRYPGIVSPSTKSDALVSFVDLVPTFLDAAALPIPDYLPGFSLLPGWKNGSNASRRRYLFSAYNAHTTGLFWPNRTISDGRHKLILNVPTLLDRERHVTGLTARSSYIQSHDKSPNAMRFQQILDATNKPPEWELFDLTDDPGETKNLAEDPAMNDVKRSLFERLLRWRSEVVADPFVEPKFVEHFCEVYSRNEKLFEEKLKGSNKRAVNALRWKLDFAEFILPWDPALYRSESHLDHP